MQRSLQRWWVWVLAAVCWCGPARAADPTDQTLDDKVDAAEADDAEVKSKRSKWNEFDLRYLTLRVGAGFLYDFAEFIQDPQSRMQNQWSQTEALRDLRLVASGRLKFAPR